MATKLAVILADFTTQLATEISVAGTTATLSSATDDDGVALPAGRYFFTLDGANSNKEHISCDLSGTSLTNIKTVTRQGVESAGVARKHRIGASVTLTDFAHILQINNLLNGTTNLNASTPLRYDGTATINNANHLATKDYVDGVAIAGAADASTTVKGISKMSVAPVSASEPIAVGDNDGRVPTQNENDALVGTSGTAVSSSNKLVDADDVSSAGASGKIVRATGTALPALSGENLTKIQSLTRVAGYAAAGNTTENTVFSTTVTGGLLSSSGMIKVKIPFVATIDNNGSGNETYTLRLKYGGSTLQTNTLTCIKGTGTGGSGYIEAWIINNAATNSQNVFFGGILGGPTTNTVVYPTLNHAADTTSAIDTTSNQTLALTVQRTDGTNSSLTFRQGIIETIYK